MCRFKNILLLVLLSWICYACSVKKYIPEGAYLYRGGTIHIKDSLHPKNLSQLKEAMNAALFPEPNSKFLGMYPGLHYHYKSKQEHPGFITRYLNKKMGEEPVYLTDVNLENTVKLLQNRMENNGYFYGDVNYSIAIDSLDKTAKIDYNVSIGKPYKMADYVVEKEASDTLAIYDHIKASLEESILKVGDPFTLSAFKKERNRIDAYLKEKGYYYFNEDFILFQIDTNSYKGKRYKLYLKLKESMPEKAKIPYVLKSVEVYPNKSKDTAQDKDTIQIDQIDFIQAETFIRPDRLRPFILLHPGQTYSPESSSYTSRRLSSIGVYKFVNIQYKEMDSLVNEKGQGLLKSKITLSPMPLNSIQLNLKGVSKSNDFTGPGIGFTYTNRNIFKGGEIFNIKGDFGYEKQFYKGNKIGSSSLSWGVKASLLFPRLLFPGHYEGAFRYAIPKTEISVGYDYLNRTDLYTLNSFSTAFSYIWEENRFVTHRLSPLKIDYVKLANTSRRFDEILAANPFLKHSFEQQFIAGLLYSFTYNELSNKDDKGQLYFRFNFDIAGNAVSLFSKDEPDGIKTFLGLKYAQYVKGDIDVSYHYQLSHSGENVLVGHIFAGIGIPYGNAKSLPFVKEYFAGGPSSVRAFHIRSLGPGSYKPEPGEYSYFDQAGDISLEANLEYRFPIISVLKGAVFADAGNVWLLNGNEYLPGGKFSSDFINEFGVGTGVGLRIDIQGFVLRFDLAAPLKRPAENWKFEYKNPVLNFAIGYPF